MTARAMPTTAGRHNRLSRQIDKAASKITVQGARYPEKLEQMTGR
jgi:hypothetical protein